jgi:hypothetical protein
MTDTDPTFDRRTVLKKSAAVPLGLTGWLAQDEPDRPRSTRRMALRYPDRLDGGPRGKIVLLTDRTDDDPEVTEVAGCGFANWPPDRLTVWEGIVVDWANAAGDFGFGAVRGEPTVRANRLVERETIFVDEQGTPVELGTAFVVSGVSECPGAYQGLTATQLPGVQIRTGPGVSTSG